MTAVMARPPGFRRGDLIPDRGYGRCYGCHKPWYAADEPVSVAWSGTSAQIAMGRGCWARATVEERVTAHRWACTEWQRMHDEDGYGPTDPPVSEITERIEQAVRSGDLNMWRHR
jgi:hypothetical protein